MDENLREILNYYEDWMELRKEPGYIISCSKDTYDMCIEYCIEDTYEGKPEVGAIFFSVYDVPLVQRLSYENDKLKRENEELRSGKAMEELVKENENLKERLNHIFVAGGFEYWV